MFVFGGHCPWGHGKDVHQAIAEVDPVFAVNAVYVYEQALLGAATNPKSVKCAQQNPHKSDRVTW